MEINEGTNSSLVYVRTCHITGYICISLQLRISLFPGVKYVAMYVPVYCDIRLYNFHFLTFDREGLQTA